MLGAIMLRERGENASQASIVPRSTSRLFQAQFPVDFLLESDFRRQSRACPSERSIDRKSECEQPAEHKLQPCGRMERRDVG
jgi:hypothetical protein